MLNCMRRRLGGKISDSKGKRVDAVGRVMRNRPLDPDLFVAVAGGGRHLHRALTIHRCTVLMYPGPAITSHQGPATDGSHTLCEACHVVP